MKYRPPPSIRSTLRGRVVPAIVASLVLTAGWVLQHTRPLQASSTAASDVSRTAALRGNALPETLSETGLFADLAALRPADDLVPYELNVPFWSDGANKTRWLRLPAGTQMHVTEDGRWTLPAGTTLVKHFEIATDASKPQATRRLETRVLVVAADGTVDGATYRWRPDGRDADIVYERADDLLAMRDIDGATRTQSWHFMPAVDCRGCHTPQAGGTLGLTTAQLNRDVKRGDTAAINQIAFWRERGLVTTAANASALPALAHLDDSTVPIETRARTWLAVNCAQCHTPGGARTEFDLRLTTPLAEQGLVGGRPRINLGIDNARNIALNDPWRSLILRRIETLDGNRMPPLAHERVDEQGRALLREWIASLPGPPVLEPPTIEFSTSATVPLTVTLSHSDDAAIVRYTLDGSAPTASAPAYGGPIHLEKPATLRARAFRDGHTRSVIAQQTFTR